MKGHEGRNSCGVNKSFMGRDRRKERPFVQPTHHSLSASERGNIFAMTNVAAVGLGGWHVASRCQLSARPPDAG